MQMLENVINRYIHPIQPSSVNPFFSGTVAHALNSCQNYDYTAAPSLPAGAGLRFSRLA